MEFRPVQLHDPMTATFYELEAALERFETAINAAVNSPEVTKEWQESINDYRLMHTAARRQLALIPQRCPECKVVPGFVALGKPCPTCASKGYLYQPALVEWIRQIIDLAYGVGSGGMTLAVLDAINDWNPARNQSSDSA